MNDELKQISLIGFGEAASAFAEGWCTTAAGNTIHAYDIKTGNSDDDVSSAKWRDYDTHGVTGKETATAAVENAPAIFSLVTADQANIAAQSVADAIQPGAFFFDCNSCAPHTKRQSAAILEQVGARYVDVAVMSPVHPKLHKTPLLISGPHADEALEFLTGLEMEAKIVPGDVGVSSSVKMVRSIMMKGLEALMMECVLAGRTAGVDEMVLDSLEVTYPGFNWKEKAAYMFERVMTHGERRYAEMEEVVKTIDNLGLSSAMASATVGWMHTGAGLDLDAKQIGAGDYARLADAVLAELTDQADITAKPRQEVADG